MVSDGCRMKVLGLKGSQVLGDAQILEVELHVFLTNLSSI